MVRPEVIRVLTYQEMVARFGPPPARLKGSLKRGDVIALVVFARGGGAIVGLRQRVGLWRVTLLTD